MFVESRDIVVRGFGVGKLVETNGLRGVIRYFVSPTDPQVDRVVARDSIHDVELTSHERVFFRQGGTWRVGRLEGYVAPDELGLRLPNMDRARVRVEDAYVRSNLPLPNPLGLLKARNTETPFWHEGRAAFLRSVAEQRAVYRGLAALASSNVEVLRHQIAVAHRVLRDPVPRYLLADEVGLGKTIEAGLIVRQHLSDKQNRALVVVAVPENLVGQWESELRDRFHIDYSFQVYVVGHRELPRCAQEYQNISFLVIDEAHEVARHAYDESESGAWYRAAGQIANRCEGVLLLSATPVLHHEDAFLAMLHLLDPATHPLEHRERFRRRVENREVVANSVRDLEDGATGFFIEPVLEQLAPLSVGNPHLVELIDTVAGLLDQSVDDPNRQRAIAKLRTHLQECYRLDRRLLRTRRAQERVRDNLPRRARQIWELEDAGRLAAFEWLDQWRFNAADAEDRELCRTTFLDLLGAGLSHPTILVAAVQDRRAVLARENRPLFDGESAFLDAFPHQAPVSRDPRVDALVRMVSQSPRRSKFVVFATDAAVADDVARALAQRVPTRRLAGDSTAIETLAAFREDAGLQVLVCDETGEQGLNLQGLRAHLVHFDLPLAPNRIEQRIGRLDRLGGDRLVTSYVPMLAGPSARNYEAAWARCLIEAVGVFTRSVASLQHVLDVGRARLGATIVDGGTDALDDLREAWQADKGQLSLSCELRRVEAQELLDQLEDTQSEFFETIEAYEYATEPTLAETFGCDIGNWAVRTLGFERHTGNDGDNDPIEFEYTRHTLLAATHVARLFKGSLCHTERRRDPCTGWMAFDRDRATELRVPLARIGHPFIEDLQRLTHWEDRGRAYAYCRVIDHYDRRFARAPGDLFFRFDFLVTADVAGLAERVRAARLSVAAVSRHADEVFPPLFHTVWVDVDGTLITDSQLLTELGRPYSKHDTNLRDTRWVKVDDLGIVADWARVCELAEAAARTQLAHAVGLEARSAAGLREIESRSRADLLLLQAREAALGAGTEAQAIDTARQLGAFLSAAVERPCALLDSVGAVFVLGRDLFGG